MKEYQKLLRLDFDPFAPGSISRDYFAGGGRQQLLEKLIVLSLGANTIIGVTGCLGSGKTTLVDSLCSRISGEAECVTIAATLFMSPSQFLQQLVGQLSVDASACQDANTSVNEICELAARLDMELSSIVLLIDDAHELSAEVLGVIFKLLNKAPHSIHVLCFGEKQLGQLLHTTLSPARAESLVMLELVGLGAEEILDYIRFKLATAGFDGKLPLAGTTISTLQDSSNGIPGKIHALLVDALNDDSSNELIGAAAAEPIDGTADSRGLRVAVAALLAVLIAAAVVWRLVVPAGPARPSISASGQRQLPVLSEAQLAPQSYRSPTTLEANPATDETRDVAADIPVQESPFSTAVSAPAGLEPVAAGAVVTRTEPSDTVEMLPAKPAAEPVARSAATASLAISSPPAGLATTAVGTVAEQQEPSAAVQQQPSAAVENLPARTAAIPLTTADPAAILASSTPADSLAPADPSAILASTTPAESLAPADPSAILASSTPAEPLATADPAASLAISTPAVLAAALVPTMLSDGDISEFEQELLNYPAKNFAVQLLGSRSEASVRQFLAALQLTASRGYFETLYMGQPWFVVVYGNFGDRRAANQVIGQLPETLRSLQPWVRPMGDIQADIRQLNSIN